MKTLITIALFLTVELAASANNQACKGCANYMVASWDLLVKII